MKSNELCTMDNTCVPKEMAATGGGGTNMPGGAGTEMPGGGATEMPDGGVTEMPGGGVTEMPGGGGSSDGEEMPAGF